MTAKTDKQQEAHEVMEAFSKESRELYHKYITMMVSEGHVPDKPSACLLIASCISDQADILGESQLDAFENLHPDQIPSQAECEAILQDVASDNSPMNSGEFEEIPIFTPSSNGKVLLN